MISFFSRVTLLGYGCTGIYTCNLFFHLFTHPIDIGLTLTIGLTLLRIFYVSGTVQVLRIQNEYGLLPAQDELNA